MLCSRHLCLVAERSQRPRRKRGPVSSHSLSSPPEAPAATSLLSVSVDSPVLGVSCIGRWDHTACGL